MDGPQIAFSDNIHKDKYRANDNDFRAFTNRVTNALSDDPDHFNSLRPILGSMRFMPGGRIQAGAGSLSNVTMHNCFVSGTIEDSFVDGDGHIMQRCTEAAATMRMGGGMGYDFSTLRPYGDVIKKLLSQSSGPLSFMEIWQAICKCIASAGHRRGAQMAVMRIDHPDIESFINAKQPSAEHYVLWEIAEGIPDANLRQRAITALQATLPFSGFNMSVAVTDDFMESLYTGKPFELKFGGRVYKEVDPANLWDALMRSTWDWGEPGVLYIDTINRMNNLWYCETISATNPCGEQPLPPFGACLLGSFNLTKYLVGVGKTWHFDWDQLGEDIPHVVRAMDNVVDLGVYPLIAQRQEAHNKRRMGLGITGLANTIEALGFAYGHPDFLAYQNDIQARITADCYRASIELAKEKGAFPAFDRDKYCAGEFIKTLPADVQDGIAKHGIRNSHLTSIAPTGTISLAADNISSGVEPVFAYKSDRVVQYFDGPRIDEVQDYGYRVFGTEGKTADRVTVREHLEVLATAQKHSDSSVSKTCNVPGTTTWEQFKTIYADAWEMDCKGCTTFRIDGRRMGIMSAKKDDDLPEEGPASVCYQDPTTGKKECE